MDQNDKLRAGVLGYLESEEALKDIRIKRDRAQAELLRLVRCVGRDVILGNRRFHIHNDQLCIETHDAIVLSTKVGSSE